MSAIQAWMEDVARMPGLEGVRWQPFRHRQTTQVLTDEALRAALEALGPVTGWVTEPSRVLELHEETIELGQRPLSGEFFQRQSEDGRQHVWQLTCQPRDRWSLVRHELEACEPGEADTLGEATNHLHVDDAVKCLQYWRLWQPDDEGAPACRIALLVDMGGSPE